jgi:sigma-B regulation protein RsbU (phosphoserine phosphatase)
VLAARYRAAGELNEVGGDFYDVFARSDEEWAMVVGDVSGKGAEAAAVTALARYTLRTAAMGDEHPQDALARLNSAMLVQDDTTQFATAVLAYMSAVPGDRLRVRLSLAGHPPPLVVRRDGTVTSFGVFGTMLGLRPDPVLAEAEAILGPGDVMLLYTDGVTEAGPRAAPLGDRGLAGVLEGLAGRSPQQIVDAVELAVVDAQDGEPRDDIALLALSMSTDA